MNKSNKNFVQIHSAETLETIQFWKWYVAKYGDPNSNLCSAFNPSQVHTHSSEHTPGAVEGSVPCSRAPQSCIEVREAVHSLPPPTIPPGPRLKPAPQPLGYESDSLTIRPRLPQPMVLQSDSK